MIRKLQMFITPTSALIACVCVCLLAPALAAEKWSRQLEPTSPGVSDSFDWVPVAQPVDSSTSRDRSENGRVLTYSQAFPPNGRFGDSPKQHNSPVSQQQPFDFPYQFQRFINGPPRSQVGSPFGAPPLKAAAPSQSFQGGDPTSQSFFKFEMPFRTDGSNRDVSRHPSSLQTGYQIQHAFGGGAQATLFSSPLFNQQPVFPPEFHPIPQKPLQQSLQKPLPQQNYIEDSFPTKNVYRESKPNPTQQSLQSVTPQVFPVGPQVNQFFDLNNPSSFNDQSPFQQADTAPTAPFQQSATAPTAPASAPASHGDNQQDVQLLYVPYDTLYNQQKPGSHAFELNKFNVNTGLPTVNPFQINQFYTQDSLDSLDQPNYFTTSPSTSTSRPRTTTLKPTTVFQKYANTQLTTPRPKPKAHQPPLAMFLVRNSARPTQADVVSALRHSHTISVIDTPTKKIPEIFVGPSGMSTPDGYAKFDLPYLSQLTQTRELRDVPFFVAPLSYRTPNGFNKILLPEPHVGSIVINLGRSNSAAQEVASQPAKPSVVYSQNDVNQYQPPQPTQRVRPHRVKQPSSTKGYYPTGVHNEPSHKNRDQFEITTQRATLAPTRGNKFNYFYNQDAIHEVSSPKVTKHDRPKKKRPQNVQQQQQPIEQPAFTQTINNPYAQFQPAPNQIINDDIYKVQSNRPVPSTSSSTSTTTTTTSTTSTTAAPTFYTFDPNGQVEFQTANGPLYPFGTIAKEPVEEQAPRFTTRPPTSTTAEEEYRMKQYYRQQDAFRNRPQVVNPTNPPFEQVQYTPVDLDYERDVNSPSTTHSTTSTTKQRITFYSPSQPGAASAPGDTYNIAPQPDFAELQQDKDIQTNSKPHRKQPSNHRPSYNQNEIPDSTVEYDPNPYHVPSELPPLTPNLPGLVNNLQEKDKQNALGELATTTPTQPEKEVPTRPTRRPINRVRKPVVSKVTSSVSYSEAETSTRRPGQRVRRPFGARATASTAAPDTEEEEATSTTRRPSSVTRNPLIRNPNRIRYQPTPEERQSLRTKQRKKYGEAGKDQDLEYQRDVLKQNYPVIKPLSSRTPSSPTAIPSSYATNTGSEAPTSETQQVYTVTPSNTVETNEQTFPAGMLEPMQIAQQYSQYTKDNFGPGYFPNQEDFGPTEPIIRNEINPVFTTLPSTTPATTTTTTEEPQVTTRRSPFIRRNYPRLRTITTEVPTTTTPETEMKSSQRPRTPPRKVIKVRTRTRRPQTQPTSTANPEEEAEVEEPKNNFRKINRFNHDLYENDATPPQRRRQRPTFQLDGQESQWSPALKLGSNQHFKPSNLKELSKVNEHKIDEEPEIVTIGPENDKNADNFDVNVSASFGEAKPTLKAPNLKPEKSFAELLEEVMGKAPEEKPLESVEVTSTRTTDGTFFESQKTTLFNRINRRNKFKRLKLPTPQNNESFETSESQGLGPQLYNSLYGKEKSTDEIVSELKTTTPLTPAPKGKISATTLTTTVSPLNTTYIDEPTTPDQLEVTSYATTLAMDDAVDKTTNAPVESYAESATAESATRRMDEVVDDLESQPSIFSEVKKQLHDLFTIDESEDHAVTAALAAVGKRRQEYMNIKRTKPDSTTQAMNAGAEMDAAPTEPTLSAIDKKPSQKNLMDQVVYATATSTKVTSETEICYRGRCIRSEDLPANHKLH